MSSRFLTLGRWYGTPLSPEQGTGLLARIETKERARLRRGAGCVMCRLARLVARFWLGEPVVQEYQDLAARLSRRHSPRARALLELVYGELLAARRQRTALAHLEQGFAEGRPLFAPDDYFAVLKRHALLRLVPAAPDGPPLALEDLLTTARVIERLQATVPAPARRAVPDHV